MKHHTKSKGDLGVFRAQADLAEQRYTVLLPFAEHAAFDLVAYKRGRFRRIQVKYRSLRNGGLELRFRSYWSDSNGLHVKQADKQADKEAIDLYCVYCPDTDSCYYLNLSDFEASVKLRVEAPSNNQRSGVHFASDYRRVP